MKGFMNANFASKSKLDKLTGMKVSYPVDPRKEQDLQSIEKMRFM